MYCKFVPSPGVIRKVSGLSLGLRGCSLPKVRAESRREGFKESGIYDDHRRLVPYNFSDMTMY